MDDALNRRIDIHTCQQHHTVIRYLLDRFPGERPAPPEDTFVLLTRLKRLLVRHFRLEDRYVYPALCESADGELRATASESRLRMGNLMRVFADFYERWRALAIGCDPETFEREWSHFRETLLPRMDTEDSRLYPKAEAHIRLLLSATGDDLNATGS